MARTRSNKQERVEVSHDIDVARAAAEALALARLAGFAYTEQYMVSTAVSELARNIVTHAVRGEITIRIVDRQSTKGIEVVAQDSGPGIPDIAAAMKDDFSMSNSLGLGLPGAKRLTDEFMIDTGPAGGTRITLRKWV